MSNIESRVAAGAEWLDSYKSNWYKLVDIDVLNMENSDYCIAGQVFLGDGTGLDDGYDHVLKLSDEYEFDTYDYGFDGERNNGKGYWINEINKRMEKDSMNPREALQKRIVEKRNEIADLEEELYNLPTYRYLAIYHSTKQNYSFNLPVVRASRDRNNRQYPEQIELHDSIEAAREYVSRVKGNYGWTYTIMSIDDNSNMEVVERG